MTWRKRSSETRAYRVACRLLRNFTTARPSLFSLRADVLSKNVSFTALESRIRVSELGVAGESNRARGGRTDNWPSQSAIRARPTMHSECRMSKRIAATESHPIIGPSERAGATCRLLTAALATATFPGQGCIRDLRSLRSSGRWRS